MNDSYDVIALYMLNFTTLDMEILRYTYDNMERLLSTSVERDGAEPVLLCSNTYDDLTGYHYQVKDYRGDVRAVVAQNGTLEETNSYYPYGMLHGISAIASTQPYKYTGKELDRENGLDWYDFEARMLMPDLGRTTTMDPLSEKYYGISPYAWCVGNPINTKSIQPISYFKKLKINEGSLTVLFSRPLSSGMSIVVRSVVNENLYQKYELQEGLSETTLNISSLNSGVYLISLYYNNQLLETKQIIK